MGLEQSTGEAIIVGAYGVQPVHGDGHAVRHRTARLINVHEAVEFLSPRKHMAERKRRAFGQGLGRAFQRHNNGGRVVQRRKAWRRGYRTAAGALQIHRQEVLGVVPAHQFGLAAPAGQHIGTLAEKNGPASSLDEVRCTLHPGRNGLRQFQENRRWNQPFCFCWMIGVVPVSCDWPRAAFTFTRAASAAGSTTAVRASPLRQYSS